MGEACQAALASSTYVPFTWRLLTFTGWNLKCHVIIMIKTDLSGVCCPNAIRLVNIEPQIPQAKALGIWLPVLYMPSCIGTTNPSRTGLNPLNNTRNVMPRVQKECLSIMGGPNGREGYNGRHMKGSNEMGWKAQIKFINYHILLAVIPVRFC